MRHHYTKILILWRGYGMQSVDKFAKIYNKSRNGATRNDGFYRAIPSLRCAPFRLLPELVDGLRGSRNLTIAALISGKIFNRKIAYNPLPRAKLG